MSIKDLTDEESLSRLFDGNLSGINTAIPGEVVTYNRSAQTVDVKVNFSEWRETDEDSEEEEWTELSGVRLQTLQANNGQTSISLPVKKGDPVQLIFNQRSLDEYEITDGKQKVTPQDLRMHDISDAVAYLGDCSKNKLPDDATHDDNLIINVSGTQIIIKPDGVVSIVGTRLNIGSDGASTAIARGDNTESRLGAIETKINFMLTTALAAGGLLLPPVPPLIPGAGVSSGKAFTND